MQKLYNKDILCCSEVEKQDEGWKSKLKLPPPDRRIKTSVSIL